MTTRQLPPIDPAELPVDPSTDLDAGFGALRTEGGNLPLTALSVHARLVGLTSRVTITQQFVNPHRDPLEAVYVFPLPDRGAVTAMRMTAADRTVVARLSERAAARAEYEQALAAGRRAALAEEERPDVFTMRVGNILPNESVSIELTVVGVLPVADGEATFRFPLVVAPRYVPGVALPSDSVGEGHAPDTDAVPDASRISPPVLLPGFPQPVRLDVVIDLDPAGLPMGRPRSSLHAVQIEGGRIRIEPGSRADRDVVLRIPIGLDGTPSVSLGLVPDEGPTGEGTFQLTVLPPALGGRGRPRDVVLLLDRSGSMAGWKLVAARRAAARIVDTLGDRDRFAVLAFDDRIDTPAALPPGLVAAGDRQRFRAVEFLAGLTARGGTELAEPLRRSLELLGDRGADRDRVLVLVTDGQVGNEDQLLRAHAGAIGGIRLHAVGIDRAINAGFLGRLASLGGGRCELVESEDRLDQAMANIHGRIATPLVSGLRFEPSGLPVIPGSVTPARLPDLFAGVPYVVRGRYRARSGAPGPAAGAGDDLGVALRGVAPDGGAWSVAPVGRRLAAPAVTAAWARAVLRDLEDRYVVEGDRFTGLDEPADLTGLERQLVATSLRFGVLCRFTAFVAVDDRVVTDGSSPRTVLQPVEPVSGWEQPVGPPPGGSRSVLSGVASAAVANAGVAMPRAVAPAPRLFRARFSGRPVAASPLPPSADPGDVARDDEDFVVSLLEIESRRLHALDTAPRDERRDALLDLASRLVPLFTDLPDASDRLRPDAWRALIDLLLPGRLTHGSIDEVWAAVLRAMDALVARLKPIAPGRGATSPSRR